MGAATLRAPPCLGTRVTVGTDPAGRFARSWCPFYEVISPFFLGGMQDLCRLVGLFICYLASGQGWPGELWLLPGCLSQGTPIKGTNWTAIHQSLPLRPAPQSSCSQAYCFRYRHCSRFPCRAANGGAGTHSPTRNTHTLRLPWIRDEGPGPTPNMSQVLPSGCLPCALG